MPAAWKTFASRLEARATQPKLRRSAVPSSPTTISASASARWRSATSWPML
jgi:hypothetical protein